MVRDGFVAVDAARTKLMLKSRESAYVKCGPLWVVLSRDEASRLIAAAPSLKHHTALSIAYSARCAPAM